MKALAAALIAFQADMPTVKKAKTANVGSYSYDYADLADLTHMVMPILNKHGLSFICTPRATDDGYEMVGVLLHESGENLEGSLPIYGRSPQDIGSAVTYMRRYLFGCLTGVVTEKDTDGVVSKTATRTTKKDWDAVLATAAGIKDVDVLKELWNSEGVGAAPQPVKDAVKAHGDRLQKQADLDALAEAENVKGGEDK